MKKLSTILTGALLLTLTSSVSASLQKAAEECCENSPSTSAISIMAKQDNSDEIAKLEKAFKGDPKDINKQTAYSTAVTQAMEQLQKAGERDKAIALGERAASLLPPNVTLLHLLGSCFLDRFCYGQNIKDYEKAKAYWGKLIQAQPTSADAMLIRGLTSYEKGDYNVALRHFQSAFNARKSDPYTLVFAGMTLAKLDNHQQAAQGLGMAYNKLKNNPAFLASLAKESKLINQTDIANQRLAEANKCKHPKQPLRTLTDIFPTQAPKPVAPPQAPAQITAPPAQAGTTVSQAPAAPPSPQIAKTDKKDDKKQAKIEKKVNPAADTPYRGLTPFPGQNPSALTEAVQVVFTTDAGDITMEVYPQAAPNAAQRFLELVKSGFYDNTPIYRVVRTPYPFVAQFGINWRPEHKVWQQRFFKDDPSIFQLQPGTLAFAKAGKDINSTQVFINYGDNNFLRNQGFTTFARIIDGYEIATKFKSVGNPSMGLEQGRLWNDGEKYLSEQKVKPNMIIRAQIVE